MKPFEYVRCAHSRVAGIAAAACLVTLAGAGRSQETAAAPPEPQFSFALVADVQYADKPDSGKRRYSTSLERLEQAVQDWSDEELAFTVQLGDIIDGADSDERESLDLSAVLARFSDAPQPLRHVVGNHCLELPRAELEERLSLSPSWYSFTRDGWRFVVVDSLWLGTVGRQVEDTLALDAQRYLERHAGVDQARPWNGALGPAQRAWLADELAAADHAGERVVVFSHLPVLAASAHPAALLWDHADVLALLERAPAFHAWIAGHHHEGGYAQINGRHFLTVRGMVEAVQGDNAYAVVHARADALVIDGRGAVVDRVLKRSVEPVQPGAFLALPSDASHPALTEYLGREIAQTMHWRGAEWLLRETREKEEAPKLLLDALEIAEGSTVVDYGCGNGFHSLRVAERVGPNGRVLGVDIQPEMLAMLKHRAKQAEVSNIEQVLATELDPGLVPASADLILMVDVYHELNRPALVLQSARRALRGGGRLALVEFRSEDESVPIKAEHKMSAEQVMQELEANGFTLEARFDELPWQHLLIFRPAW